MLSNHTAVVPSPCTKTSLEEQIGHRPRPNIFSGHPRIRYTLSSFSWHESTWPVLIGKIHFTNKTNILDGLCQWFHSPTDAVLNLPPIREMWVSISKVVMVISYSMWAFLYCTYEGVLRLTNWGFRVSVVSVALSTRTTRPQALVSEYMYKALTFVFDCQKLDGQKSTTTPTFEIF